jgi:hypothetical protein
MVPIQTIDIAFCVNTHAPPAVTLRSPINTTYQTDPQLQLTVNKPVSWIGYSLNGQNNVTLAETASKLTGLANGLYNLQVYATDTMGITVASETVTFIIDNPPPTVSVLAPNKKTYHTNEISLKFTVNEAATKITYCLDKQENITIHGNTTLTELANRNHNVTVYATDENGNTGASETIHFNVDTAYPVLVITAASVAVAATTATVLIVFTKTKRDKNKKKQGILGA